MEREQWHPVLFLQWHRVLTKGLKETAEISLKLKKGGKFEFRRTGKKKTQKDKPKCFKNYSVTLTNGQEQRCLHILMGAEGKQRSDWTI